MFIRLACVRLWLTSTCYRVRQPATFLALLQAKVVQWWIMQNYTIQKSRGHKRNSYRVAPPRDSSVVHPKVHSAATQSRQLGYFLGCEALGCPVRGVERGDWGKQLWRKIRVVAGVVWPFSSTARHGWRGWAELEHSIALYQPLSTQCTTDNRNQLVSRCKPMQETLRWTYSRCVAISVLDLLF